MFLSFDVLGLPVPQGSKRVVRGRVIDANAMRLKPWRSEVAHEARAAMHADPLPTEPMRVHVTFYFPRPRHHYRTGKHSDELRADAPKWVTTRPDLDKLERAVLDALTGVVWRDDSQVVAMNAAKLYTEGPPHVRLVIHEATPWG